MKNNLFFAFLLSTLLWSACSNDFDVTAPWKDIPVVYGLLDLDADVHYIRLEKAFLDPDRSALADAQIVDSLYYDNATVQLIRKSNDQAFTMTRVDGNDSNVGLTREVGIFAQAPNWLYRVSGSQIDLQEGEEIEISIDRGNGLPLVTALTTIQGPMKKVAPFGNNFDFVPNFPTSISWAASEEAKIFDIKLVINYAEFPRDAPDQVEQKSLEWIWAKGITFDVFSNSYKIEREGIEFYSVLASSLADDPNIDRIFIDMDLIVESGGTELERYINVALANTGITGSQELPSYSNMSEGMGIFSTQSTLTVKGMLLSTGTRDTLANGPITKHLNFQ